MNVDAALIEKITKLVMSELKQRQASPSMVTYPPLTEDDIKRWNHISSLLNSLKTSENVTANYDPLTESEIKRWNEIASSLDSNVSKGTTDAFSHGQVKFYRIDS